MPMGSFDRTCRQVEHNHPKNQRLLLMLFIGFLMVFAGIITLTIALLLSGNGTINFGGIIFIGPIPIVIGAGPEAVWMILIAIVLAMLSIVMFLVMNRRMEKAKG